MNPSSPWKLNQFPSHPGSGIVRGPDELSKVAIRDMMTVLGVKENEIRNFLNQMEAEDWAPKQVEALFGPGGGLDDRRVAYAMELGGEMPSLRQFHMFWSLRAYHGPYLIM